MTTQLPTVIGSTTATSPPSTIQSTASEWSGKPLSVSYGKSTFIIGLLVIAIAVVGAVACMMMISRLSMAELSDPTLSPTGAKTLFVVAAVLYVVTAIVGVIVLILMFNHPSTPSGAEDRLSTMTWVFVVVSLLSMGSSVVVSIGLTKLRQSKSYQCDTGNFGGVYTALNALAGLGVGMFAISTSSAVGKHYDSIPVSPSSSSTPLVPSGIVPSSKPVVTVASPSTLSTSIHDSGGSKSVLKVIPSTASNRPNQVGSIPSQVGALSGGETCPNNQELVTMVNFLKDENRRLKAANPDFVTGVRQVTAEPSSTVTPSTATGAHIGEQRRQVPIPVSTQTALQSASVNESVKTTENIIPTSNAALNEQSRDQTGGVNAMNSSMSPTMKLLAKEAATRAAATQSQLEGGLTIGEYPLLSYIFRGTPEVTDKLEFVPVQYRNNNTVDNTKYRNALKEDLDSRIKVDDRMSADGKKRWQSIVQSWLNNNFSIINNDEEAVIGLNKVLASISEACKGAQCIQEPCDPNANQCTLRVPCIQLYRPWITNTSDAEGLLSLCDQRSNIASQQHTSN